MTTFAIKRVYTVDECHFTDPNVAATIATDKRTDFKMQSALFIDGQVFLLGDEEPIIVDLPIDVERANAKRAKIREALSKLSHADVLNLQISGKILQGALL